MQSGEGVARRAPSIPAPAFAGTDRRARGLLRAVVATARPRQWLKNALVIAAPGAAGALGRDDVPGRVAVACVAFCALASGIYAINDVRDAEEDRGHPVKCRRPVAAGELGVRGAIAFGTGAIAAGLVLCAAIRPLLGLVGLAYVLLTVSYTLIWRRLLLLDVLAVAGGFLLRATAGGAAAPVDLSEWFLLVVSCAAVLVAGGKRWAELRRTAAAASSRRGVLRHYTEARLRALLLLSAAGALASYTTWAFVLPSSHGIPWRPLTILPFAACLIRYGVLVRDGHAEAPEELFTHDRPLLAGAASWLVLFALAVNAGA